MDVWQHIWQVLAALGGTVALIFGLAFLARRMQRTVAGHGQQLAIVESLHLGAKERLLLVNIGQQQVLLGVTAQQISHLTAVDVVDPAIGQPATQQPAMDQVDATNGMGSAVEHKR